MNPEETIKAIDNIIKEVKKIPDKVELYATNEMYNTLSVRIINGKKNTAGGSLGTYKSKSWKKKRDESGRQSDEIDLNFTGNLLASFTRGKENGKWVVGFSDGITKSLDRYSPKERIKRKSKAKTQKKRSKPISTGRARKPPKKIQYPGTAKLSELVEENLDMVIFTPNKTEVSMVIKSSNRYGLNQLSKIADKYLK